MKLVTTNPNDTPGGGGCLCHPIKSTDTAGPFIVFPATETDSNASPYAVLCAGCVRECRRLMLNKKDALAGGEKGDIEVIEL